MTKRSFSVTLRIRIVICTPCAAPLWHRSWRRRGLTPYGPSDGAMDAFANNVNSYGANAERRCNTSVMTALLTTTSSPVLLLIGYSRDCTLLVSLLCEGQRKGSYLHIQRQGTPKGTEKQYARASPHHYWRLQHEVRRLQHGDRCPQYKDRRPQSA